MANRAIIYRLYPTASQKLLLTKTFGCCRFVYNRLLSVQQERYKNGEKHLSRTHAIEGNCGCGWDIECYCEDSVDAKRQLRTYQDNVGYPVRIKKWREKIV